MAIITQGPNPASRSMNWADVLSPAAQAAGQYAGQHREQQQNIAQSSILQSVIDEIANKGDQANFNDILSAFAKGQGQGLRPEYAQQYLENAPKFMEQQRRATQPDPQYLAAQAEMRKAHSEEQNRAYKINEEIIKPIQKNRLQTSSLDSSLKQAMEAINSGNVGFMSPAHIAQLSGFQSLMSPEGKLLKNAMKDYYGLVKQYFGGNPSNFETQQIEDLLAKAGANEHANRVAVYTLMGKNELDKLKAKVYDDIRRDNQGDIPLDFAQEFTRRMAEGQEAISKDVGRLIDQEMRAYNEGKSKGSYREKKIQGQGEGGRIPGAPEVLGRSQMVKVRHKKSGKTASIPQSEYHPHPDYELAETGNQ